MAAAVFGCIFGILGIFTIGAIFVPLAALCTAIALLSGVFARQASVLVMAIVSGCVTAIAFIVSPSAWLLFGGILLAMHKASNVPPPSHDAAPPTTPAPNDSTAPPANDSSNTPSPADVRRAGVSCKAIIATTGPHTGDDGLKHSNITCLDGFSGAMTLRDGTWSLDAPNVKEPSVSPNEQPLLIPDDVAHQNEMMSPVVTE